MHESVCKSNLSIFELSKLLCETNYIKNNIFFHMNVRSPNKNINKIDELLGLLPCFPEVMVISETKLKNFNYNFISIENCHFPSSNSLTNSAGIGMYLKISLSYKICPDLCLNKDLVKDIWVEIKTNNCTKAYVVGGIYFDPHSSISNFQFKLKCVIEKIIIEGLKYFILGDFNINLRSDAPPIIQYKESFELLGAINLINCLTRYMNMQTPSLLDHIYCNNCFKNIISGSISHNITDHKPVFAMIPKNKVSPTSRPPQEILKQDFSKFF